VTWSARTLAPRNHFLASFVVYSAFLLGRFKWVQSCQSGRTQWALGPGRSAEEIFTPTANPCADESLGLTVMTTTTWWSQSYINLSLQPAAFRCACVCWHRDRSFPPEGTEECVNSKGNRFCLLCIVYPITPYSSSLSGNFRTRETATASFSSASAREEEERLLLDLHIFSYSDGEWEAWLCGALERVCGALMRWRCAQKARRRRVCQKESFAKQKLLMDKSMALLVPRDSVHLLWSDLEWRS